MRLVEERIDVEESDYLMVLGTEDDLLPSKVASCPFCYWRTHVIATAHFRLVAPGCSHFHTFVGTLRDPRQLVFRTSDAEEVTP